MLVTVIADASHCHQHMVTGMACWAKSQRVHQGVQATNAVQDDRITNALLAEVCAVVLGINTALMRGVARRGDEILVQSDCTGVEAFLEGPTDKLASKKSPFGMELAWWLHGKRAELGLRYRFKHVRGHQDPNRGGRYGVNVLCDRNARRAMRQLRNSIAASKTTVGMAMEAAGAKKSG